LADNDKKPVLDDFDLQNATALLEMLADPVTPEPVRLQILNDILENTKDNSFFETMYREKLDQGRCPHCQHQNHWLIPEEDLNIFGHVTAEKDPRVPFNTTRDECATYEEACLKKKTTI